MVGRRYIDLDSSRSPYSFIHTTKRADPNIDVKLENMDLWKRFSELNLEMIITKNGRYDLIDENISLLETPLKIIS